MPKRRRTNGPEPPKKANGWFLVTTGACYKPYLEANPTTFGKAPVVCGCKDCLPGATELHRKRTEAEWAKREKTQLF